MTKKTLFFSFTTTGNAMKNTTATSQLQFHGKMSHFPIITKQEIFLPQKGLLGVFLSLQASQFSPAFSVYASELPYLPLVKKKKKIDQCISQNVHLHHY